MKFKDLIVIAGFGAAIYFGYQMLSAPEPDNVRAQSQPPRETVFDPMVSTMGRAKAVQDMDLSRKAELDAALAEQEQ